MTKLSVIAFATLAIAGGIAAPVLAAAPTVSGSVPYCSSSEGPTLDAQKDMLSSQLQLSTKSGSNIDVWNGCLKVITTENGTTTTAFYDPNSLRLIAEV